MHSAATLITQTKLKDAKIVNFANLDGNPWFPWTICLTPLVNSVEISFWSDSGLLLGVEREWCPLNDYPPRLDLQKVGLTTRKTASAIVDHGDELDDDEGDSFDLPFERKGHHATKWLEFVVDPNDEVVDVQVFDQVQVVFPKVEAQLVAANSVGYLKLEGRQSASQTSSEEEQQKGIPIGIPWGAHEFSALLSRR